MATLSRYNRTIQDGQGNAMPFASVEVRREIPGQPLVQLYSDPDGAPEHAIGNPVTADANGFIGVHVAIDGQYQVKATFGSETQTLRYEQIGAPAPIENSMGAETEITGASYTVGTSETFLTIKRVSPTLTEIRLPPVATRAALPIAYVDWSTSIASDHEIKFIADGTETVMKEATYSVWSNAAGRARGWVYPATEISSWVVT